LHGNSIKDIKEVDKLAKLKSLRKLALHGNAIVTTKVTSLLRMLWLCVLQNWKYMQERPQKPKKVKI